MDNIHNYALKSAAGVLQAEDTLGLETVHLQELSVIVNTTSSFEEFFIRRNALVIFMHRILRSAQINNASLRPALPGASSFCTCKYGPFSVIHLLVEILISNTVLSMIFKMKRRNVFFFGIF